MSELDKSGAMPQTPREAPLRGSEYLKSLQDGRMVWLHGEQVTDVANHPAFRNAVRMVARLYDALHDQARREALLTSTGEGVWTHRLFGISRSVDDLVAEREAAAEWSRLVYGWMGQGLEEGASLLPVLGIAPELYGPYEANARRWYRKAIESALFFHHAIIDPIEREESRVAPLHIERETDAGLIVNGTVRVPSCAAFSHCSFIVHRGVWPARGRELSLTMIVPMASPGVKLLCRPTSTLTAKLYGSPFDYPLTSRLEDDNAALVFEEALIPWENVLIKSDERTPGAMYQDTVLGARTSFQEATRLSVKLEFITGLMLRSVEAAGTAHLPEVRARLGELLSYRNLFWGLTEAQARAPAPFFNGSVLPNPDHGLSFRLFSSLAYPRIRDVIERTVGSGHVYLSAAASDFMNPETRAYLERFVRGENGYTALDRVKLTKLLWDALGTEIAGRFDTIARPDTTDEMRALVLAVAGTSGLVEKCRTLAGRCLDEYDLEGWRTKDLFTPTEIAPVISQRRRTSSW